MAEYNIGTALRITAVFTDISGDAADPSVIKFKVNPPKGADEEYIYGTDTEVVRTGVGVYHFDLLLDEAGSWYYRWVGSGNVAKAFENIDDPIVVTESTFEDPL